jgi:hypothetical protein
MQVCSACYGDRDDARSVLSMLEGESPNDERKPPKTPGKPR